MSCLRGARAPRACAMNDQPRLTPDAQLLCPHCHGWHDVIAINTISTGYTVEMRYWECGGRRFYAGQDGGARRFSLRPRAPNRDV